MGASGVRVPVVIAAASALRKVGFADESLKDCYSFYGVSDDIEASI